MRTGKYHLSTCVWELTLACTYSCRHCGSSAGRCREGELTLPEALDVASQLVGIGCRRVILIGGEVFLRDDWDVIAKRLTDGGVDVSVITNGSCLNDANWQRLKAAGIDYLGISVDGTKAAHDEIRMPGAFDVAMSAIEGSKARGFSVAVITVLTAESIETIPALYGELSSRGVDAWQLQLCSPFGNAGHSEGVVPSLDSISKTVSFIAAKTAELSQGKRRMNIVAADNVGYFTPEEALLRGRPGGTFAGCAAGLSVIGIDSVGNVRGCESLYDDRFIEGNLREASLASIWNSEDAFAYNRCFDSSMLAGDCSGCAEVRRCAAGCRSINHFLTGNMYESRTCVRVLRRVRR